MLRAVCQALSDHRYMCLPARTYTSVAVANSPRKRMSFSK